MFKIIVLVIGVGLLVLGAVAGVALLKNALRSPDQYGDEMNVGTLWGLFLFGLFVGLAMLWGALTWMGL